MSLSSAPATPWVLAPPQKNLVVGVGDMIASNDAGAELITYSLGSCLGVTAYDPASRIGGLLHVMLPDSTIDPAKAQARPCMFVDTGMAKLLRAVFSLGAVQRRLLLKVAGGAQFLDQQRIFNIGERNCSALAKFLLQYSLAIQAQAVGGKSSRTLRLNLASGRVSVHSPGVPALCL